MSNIKTSDPHTDLKPIELTPSQMDSVAAGGPAEDLINVLRRLAEKENSESRGGLTRALF
jgi:hypothetical protein